MALNHATIEKYLPKYDGDRDTLDFFIEQVTMLARVADADARALFPIIVKSKLRGEAVKAVAHVPNNTVDEILNALKLKFGDNRTIEQIISEITRIRRTPLEGPLQFADRIKDLLYAAKNKAEDPESTRILENIAIEQLCKNLDIATDRLIRSSGHSTFDEAHSHLRHEIELHPDYFARKQEKTLRKNSNNHQSKFPIISKPINPQLFQQNKDFNPFRQSNWINNPNRNPNPTWANNTNRNNNQHWANMPRPTPEQWRRMYPPKPQRISDNLDSDVSMRTASNRYQNNRPHGRPVEVNNTCADEPVVDEPANDFFQENEPTDEPV